MSKSAQRVLPFLFGIGLAASVIPLTNLTLLFIGVLLIAALAVVVVTSHGKKEPEND